MTYQQLVWLQYGAYGLFFFCALAGLIYLLIGIVRPSRLGLQKRRSAVVRTFCIWFIGTVILAGTLFYTHSHPRGFHAFGSYMDDFIARQCLLGDEADPRPTQQACIDLATKCAQPGADVSHPSCKTILKWDGAKKNKGT